MGRRLWARVVAPVAVLVGAGALRAAPAAEAVLVLTGDQHSSYEREAQFVARIDRLHAEHPDLPLAVLIDGDAFEYGNVAARRSEGRVDFAALAALASRYPVVLNLGNHDADYLRFPETVTRLRAAGVHVVSNLNDHATGAPLADASVKLHLGDAEVVIVGIGTDSLSTYRVAVRPELAIPAPVVWGREHLPGLLAEAPVHVVLSHAGIAADRQLLPLLPDGTLFGGGHNHLRFVYREGRTVYVHSGSWNDTVTLAWLHRDVATGETSWDVKQEPLSSSDPADPETASLIAATQKEFLTPDDVAPLGHLPGALAPAEAARWVVDAVREAAGADAAFVGNTTFGAGLPAGEVRRVDLDACVRFEGTIYVAEVDAATLAGWLTHANQGPDTPFDQRGGEYLVAAGTMPQGVAGTEDGRSYRLATTDWCAHHASQYFPGSAVAWQEVPALKIKEITTAALAGGAGK